MSGGQLFFRGGVATLTGGSRSGEVFTDTNQASGKSNNARTGFDVDFGLDVPLLKDPWFGNSLLGEVMIGYAQFSDKSVVQPTSALLGTPTLSNVPVSELNIVAAPKYRIDWGRFRPWVIPVGLEYFVISPPSNNTSYLDLGLHFGGGLDFVLANHLSTGIDVRYHQGFNIPGANAISYLSGGAYLSFNW